MLFVPRALFESAYFTARHVRLVGQDVSHGKCVLLSTSKAVRRAMKLWDISGDGGFWKVQLMSGIWVGILISLSELELELFPREGLLSGLLQLTLYVWASRSNWGWFVVSIYLLASMLLKHLMSPPRLLVLSGLLLFERFGPPRCLLQNAPAILNLLDGPVGGDHAFHIVWSRFRMMRRFLAYCPEEEPRIFRMLDWISRGAQGHGLVHIIFISAAELGFARMGWVRVSLPPLRMKTGPVQHLYSSILDAWRFSVFAKLSERKGFLAGEFAVFHGSLQLLTSSHLREREKMLVKSHFVWRCLEGRRSLSLLWQEGW